MLKILLIDFGCPNVNYLCDLLQYNNCKYIRITNNKIPNLLSFNGIILSGGPKSVTVDNHPSIDKYILDMNIPILGICYGAQLITKLKLGTVVTHHNKLLGWKTLNICNKSKLYRGLYHQIYIYCKHDDIITYLPDEFIVTSYNCNKKVIMSFEHKKDSIYGVQYHPDVIDSKEGEIIIKNFIRICSDGK